jgi:ATP adenylyltransferase
MVIPYQHLDELQKLPKDAAQEMMSLCQRTEKVLRSLYHPEGINLGMNLGVAAGAGVAGHIHMHVLPRWVADANFMTVVAETRILPETLETTWQRMRKEFGGNGTMRKTAPSDIGKKKEFARPKPTKNSQIRKKASSKR